MSTCWLVPLPSRIDCVFFAPAGPNGTLISLAVSPVHHWSSGGATRSKGTSTRFAATAAWPTRLIIFVKILSSGDISGLSGHFENSGSTHVNVPSCNVIFVVFDSISLSVKPDGSVCDISTETIGKTPHRAPELAMLASRRAAVSVKFAGKLATTTKRYGSGTSASAL